MHQSSTAKIFPTLARRQLMLGCVAIFLLSCDIPYVAEGSWDVVYELPDQKRSGVWHISEENGMNVEGAFSLQIDELELAGSVRMKRDFHSFSLSRGDQPFWFINQDPF